MGLRRAILVLVTAALVGTLLWGFWLEPSSLRVQTTELPLDWPYHRPLRIAVVSDLHVGAPFQTVSHLREIVDRINATDPDLICLLGDFVTLGVLGGHFVPPEPIAVELGRLHARSGVMAVLGNHDMGSDGPRVARALAGAGVLVLQDSAVRVSTAAGPVWVAGVSDLWKGAHDIPRTLRTITDAAPIVVITHNPDIFPEVPGRVMLTLAGHTHGGQVRLPWIGSPIIPSRYGQRYARGVVVEGGHCLFVTTGIGTSDIGIRLGVPPTISVLNIRGR